MVIFKFYGAWTLMQAGTIHIDHTAELTLSFPNMLSKITLILINGSKNEFRWEVLH
jgi:hypothetical protein